MMGINGHKERALQRRGYHIQEALQRRNTINETAQLRRGLLEHVSDEDKKVLTMIGYLNDFCKEDKGFGTYCEMIKLLNSVSTRISLSINKSLFDIYTFYRDRIKTNNKTLFKKTIDVLLKNENPATSFNLIATYLTDDDYTSIDKINTLRSFIKSDGVDEEELDEFLKTVRSIGYSKYEQSFVGDDFNLDRGYVELSHGYKKDDGKNETFHKIISNVLEGKYGKISDAINLVIDNVVKTITHVNTINMIDKADLSLKNPLYVGDDVILDTGSKVEVKKMDYDADSYFSEFFAIYKNPKYFMQYNKNPYFKEIYNTIINGIYVKLNTEGQELLTKIKNNVHAIVYDNNIIVLAEDIELYWSNKGQRGCDDLRLSIRYRLNKSEVTAYVYTKNSNQLKIKKIKSSSRNKVIC